MVSISTRTPWARCQWLCCHLIWPPAICFGHLCEMGWAVNRLPLGGDLGSLARKKAGQAWKNQTYCEGLFGNVWLRPRRSSTPTSGRASSWSQDRLGTVSKSWPCSLPPLVMYRLGAGDARCHVPGMAANQEPRGGHWKLGMHQAEKKFYWALLTSRWSRLQYGLPRRQKLDSWRSSGKPWGMTSG